MQMKKRRFPTWNSWGLIYKAPSDRLDSAVTLGEDVLTNPEIYKDADGEFVSVTPDGPTWHSRGYYERPIGDTRRGQRPDNFRRRLSGMGVHAGD